MRGSRIGPWIGLWKSVGWFGLWIRVSSLNPEWRDGRREQRAINWGLTYWCLLPCSLEESVVCAFVLFVCAVRVFSFVCKWLYGGGWVGVLRPGENRWRWGKEEKIENQSEIATKKMPTALLHHLHSKWTAGLVRQESWTNLFARKRWMQWTGQKWVQTCY